MPTLTKATIDFPDSAPVRVSVTACQEASPAEVWRVLIDSEGWPDWFPGVRHCQTTLQNENGLGSRRQITVAGLRAEEEFIAWEPERLWAFTVLSTNLPVARRWVERVSLASDGLGGGTQITYDTGLELAMWTKLCRPLLIRGIRRAWHRGLHQIDLHLHSAKHRQ